jgi:small conductance mechanosensitive channel
MTFGQKIDTLREQVMLLLTTYGLDILGAVIMLAVGWTVAGWASRATRAAVNRLPWLDETLRPLLASLVRYLVLIFTLIAVLNQFGVQTTSIIAVLGAAGIAIGLALQGTLSNVAAGVMILVLRPFKVGDFIEAGGKAGTVREVGLFATEFATGDNIYISVPNSQIVAGPITNFSRHATRRIDVVVGIGYASSIEKSFEVLKGLAEADDRVLRDPPLHLSVRALGDSAVTVGLRMWVKAPDYWDVTFDMNRRVKESFDAAGIEIPFPQRVVTTRS